MVFVIIGPRQIDRLVVRDQQADAHHFHAVIGRRHEALGFVDGRFFVNAHHQRNARPCKYRNPSKPTFAPRCVSAHARFAEQVDLPTPPLPLATAMIRFTPETLF